MFSRVSRHCRLCGQAACSVHCCRVLQRSRVTDLFLFGKKQGSISGIIVLQPGPGLAASKHLHAAPEEWCVKTDEKQDIVFHNYFMPAPRAEQSMQHPDPAVKMWAIDRPAQILLCPWMEKIFKMTLLILTTTQANNLKWHLGILTMLPYDILGFQPFFRAQMSLCLNTWK